MTGGTARMVKRNPIPASHSRPTQVHGWRTDDASFASGFGALIQSPALPPLAVPAGLATRADARALPSFASEASFVNACRRLRLPQRDGAPAEGRATVSRRARCLAPRRCRPARESGTLTRGAQCRSMQLAYAKKFREERMKI